MTTSASVSRTSRVSIAVSYMPAPIAGFQRPDADARGDGLFAFLERVDGLPHVQAIKRRMTDLLGPSAGQHLLEVGCGMGHEIRRLAGRVAPGGSVLGIDMNHAMIDEARRRTADLGGAVRCQVGDVQRLEPGDAEVDGVRTERVLMYVPDQQRAVSELARVVRPGGRVVAFELDYGATLVDLPDQGTARHVLDWLAAAQDAERAGYHSDTFVGMIVSARKPDRGQHPVIAR